jgi:pyruvate formate lyase activating enzyme
MSVVIFTSTGCTRCNIIKEYMNENNIVFEEKNIKEEGKSDYQKFYAANRGSIYRGAGGIEFPIFFDSHVIKQSIGPVLAYLKYQNKLDGFVRVGDLHKEWVDGINISEGNVSYIDEFLEFIKYLKNNNLKLEMITNGENAQLLEEILKQGLVDSLIVEVKGTKELYHLLLNKLIDIQEVERTIKLSAGFPNTRFITVVAPVWENEADEGRYITAKEVGETARWIKELAGDNKIPYLIKIFKPELATNEKAKKMNQLEPASLFPYRTEARNHLVKADIEK